MSMSRKHYNMLVSAKHEAHNILRQWGKWNESSNVALGVYLVCLAVHLKRDNPNFNTEKFLSLAGVSSHAKSKALIHHTSGRG